MTDLLKVDKKELFCVDRHDIKINILLEYLMNNRKNCVYVIDNERLFGIISYSNLCNYVNNGCELINTNYKSIKDKNEIEDFINKYKNIDVVPVIDEKNNFLYEYKILRKWNELIFAKNNNKKKIRDFIKVLKECNINKIVGIENFQQICDLKEGFDNFGIYDIEISVGVSYTLEDIETTLYIDDNMLRHYYMKKKSILYNIITMQQLIDLLLQPFKYISDMEFIANLIANSYSDIAIYGNTILAKNFKEKLNELKVRYSIISNEDIEFVFDKGGYSIKNNKRYDIIVTCGFNAFNYMFYQGEKNIYNAEILLRGYQAYKYNSNVEIDIINNILPELKKRGVNLLIYELPNKCTNKEKVNIFTLLQYGILKPLYDVYADIKKNIFSFNYKKGYYELDDYESETMNIKCGIRKTVCDYKEGEKNVYFFGACETIAEFVRDAYTIPSYFANVALGKCNVYNYGMYNTSMQWRMRIPEYCNGDIVIFPTVNKRVFESFGYKVHDINNIYYDFKNCIDEVCWDFYAHCNERVNQRIAEKLYDICKEEGMIS